MRYTAWLAIAALVALLGPPLAPAAAAAAAPAAPPLAFADVSGVSWAEPAIAFLAAQGVVKGVSATSFAPDEAVDGETAVTFLARLFPSSNAQPATALAGVAAWAQASVTWAEANGVIASPAAFQPTQPAPRAQVVEWVVKALGLSTASAPAPSFNDAASIPPADADAVGAAQADGLVVGDANGNFNPSAPVTRAQLALILLRAEEALALNAGTPASAPYSWQASGTSLLAGTATTGTDTLPIGAVSAGRLTGATGTAADFAKSAGVGAGTLVTGSTRVPFLWQEPTASAPGGLWLYAAGASSPIAYAYTAPAADGTVQVTAASTLAASLGGGETLTVQLGGSGTPETASASVTLGSAAGGSSLTLQYSGPALPTAVLVATETAAAASVAAP